MSSTPASPLVRRFFLALVALGAIHFAAPWPGVQGILHVFLVLCLAPGFNSPLQGACWAGAAGWVLEGSMRVYPHFGGTALGDMLACLLAYWLLLQWPPHARNPFWGRMAALVVVHYLLVNLAVTAAAGPHAWGYGWLWSLVTVPLWATLALRMHQPIHRR